MTPRLLLRGALNPGYRALDADATHYLRTVLRLRTGATVEVFNGTGARCLAEIVTEPQNAQTTSATAPRNQRNPRENRQPLALQLKEPVTQSPEPKPRILLGFALLKGQATDEVLRKATELGATDLLPLITERTQQGQARARSQRADHWTNIVTAAAAQCQQDHLPTLYPATALDQLLTDQSTALPVQVEQKLILEPTGALWPTDLLPVNTALLIGPEGGWSTAELAMAEAAGWRSTRMGPLVLRAETAPLAALSWVTASWSVSGQP